MNVAGELELQGQWQRSDGGECLMDEIKIKNNSEGVILF